MKRKGICQKCGEEKIVQDHHFKGYGSEEVIPYCQSCDLKAHAKARKEGKCNLTYTERHKISGRDCSRRRKLIPECHEKILTAKRKYRLKAGIKEKEQKQRKEYYNKIKGTEKDKRTNPEYREKERQRQKEYMKRRRLNPEFRRIENEQKKKIRKKIDAR